MRNVCSRLATVTLALALMTLAPAGAAGGAPSRLTTGSPCVKVTVTTRPHINTAMVDEHVRSGFTNCSTMTETVLAIEHISGPFKREAASLARSFSRTALTIAPNQTVSSKRILPYVCCGTYTVHVTASVGGHQVGKARDTFTFA